MTDPIERQVPTACPHCDAPTVLGRPHCTATAGGMHPTCSWIVCSCRAVIDPAGRHTHPDHKPGPGNGCKGMKR